MKELVRLRMRPSRDKKSFRYMLDYKDQSGKRRQISLGHAAMSMVSGSFSIVSTRRSLPRRSRRRSSTSKGCSNWQRIEVNSTGIRFADSSRLRSQDARFVCSQTRSVTAYA
jgi:hypothetical protein